MDNIKRIIGLPDIRSSEMDKFNLPRTKGYISNKFIKLSYEEAQQFILNNPDIKIDIENKNIGIYKYEDGYVKIEIDVLDTHLIIPIVNCNNIPTLSIIADNFIEMDQGMIDFFNKQWENIYFLDSNKKHFVISSKGDIIHVERDNRDSGRALISRFHVINYFHKLKEGPHREDIMSLIFNN
jgi:hypothetical protein